MSLRRGPGGAHAWFHHHGLARAAHALGVSKDALKAAIATARDQAKAPLTRHDGGYDHHGRSAADRRAFRGPPPST